LCERVVPCWLALSGAGSLRFGGALRAAKKGTT
jgi:hypothetical protein